VGHKRIIRTRNVLMATLTVVLVGAAVLDQLRRPAQQRTWHGSIAGLPYDFRFPTLERVQATFWNKNTSRLLMPQVFGVGWSINFYPLLHPILENVL
jgi:hypothetical protein